MDKRSKFVSINIETFFDLHTTKDDGNQLEEWKRTRRWGFMSFSIPMSIILILSIKMYRDSSIGHMTKGLEAVQKTILYFLIWSGQRIVGNIFRYCLMIYAFGISKDDYDLIIGPRSDWSGKELDMICKTYGQKNIKMMDAINRRSGHILLYVLRIMFYSSAVGSTEMRLKTAMLQLMVVPVLKIITEILLTTAFFTHY